jgi:hypothetical protein
MAEEKELRGKLEKRIGKISERTWKELVDKSYVDEAITFGDEEFKTLVEHAQFLRWKEKLKGRPKGTSPRVANLLDPRDAARAETFAKHVARCANRDYVTRAIRKTYLPDDLFLSKEVLDRFLGSVAPRFLSSKAFADHGIPVFQHESRFVDPKSPESQPIDWTTDMVIRIEWAGGSLDIERASLLHFDANNTGLTFVPFGRRPVGVIAGSVFDEMRKASSELSQACDWTPPAALRFILTGEVPSMPAVRFREVGISRSGEFAHFPFELIIEPWVSPKTVLKVYCAAQRHLYGKQSQFLGDRTRALFDFVMDDFKPGMTWPQGCDAWNKKHGLKKRWSYSDYRNMRKDFLRAWRMIAFPGMRVPLPTKMKGGHAT